MLQTNRRLAAASWMLFAGILAMVAAGCGSVEHHAAFEAAYAPKAETRIEVGQVANRTEKDISPELSQMFNDALSQKLESDHLLWTGGAQGDHLIITTQIVEYEEGNAFQRWLLPGWGSTVLGLHCELKDSGSGRLVGSADARRTVSFGGAYSIGAWKTIFPSVADDVVKDLRSQIPAA